MDNDQSTASDTGANLDQGSSDSADTSASSGSRASAAYCGAAARKAGNARCGGDDRNDVELPEKMSEGRPSAEASERALVRKPKIGDTMPVPSAPPPGPAGSTDDAPAGRRQAPAARRQGQGWRLGRRRWCDEARQPESAEGQGRRP